jgi:hypothetical protein
VDSRASAGRSKSVCIQLADDLYFDRTHYANRYANPRGFAWIRLDLS